MRHLRLFGDLACLRCHWQHYTFSLIAPFQAFPRDAHSGRRSARDNLSFRLLWQIHATFFFQFFHFRVPIPIRPTSCRRPPSPSVEIIRSPCSAYGPWFQTGGFFRPIYETRLSLIRWKHRSNNSLYWKGFPSRETSRLNSRIQSNFVIRIRVE